VWALEAIAIWRELFSGAAQLLLSLAEAENEDISNNATGVFADLFSLGQGAAAPTEASPAERFPVLENAVRSESTLRREIGFKAAERALQTHGVGRFIGSEYQGLRRLPNLWIPKTWGELYDAYRRVWRLLTERLPSLEDAEQARVVKIMTSACRGLLLNPHLFEMIVDTLRLIGTDFRSNRQHVVEALEVSIHYDGKAFEPQQRKVLESLRAELIDTDFHSMMERYVGMNPVLDYFDDAGQYVEGKHDSKISSLASTAKENLELLRAELPWLLTSQTANGFHFGRALAHVDTAYKLLPTLLEAQAHERNSNAFFLSGYFAHMFSHQLELWEETLDEIGEDDALSRHLIELTWRSGMTSRAANRILSLLDSQRLVPSDLQMFAYGGVIRRVPEPAFKGWIEHLLASDKTVDAVVAINLIHYYYALPTTLGLLPKDLTLRALTARALFENYQEPRRTNAEYDWVQVANLYLKQHPTDAVKIAERLIESFGQEGVLNSSYNSQTDEVLLSIAKREPIEVWRLVAKRLGPPIDSRAFRLGRWLRDGGITRLASAELWAWIDEDIEHRAWYAATFIPAVLTHSAEHPSLARELLIRYGDREDVRRNLHANFGTEFWSGPASAHYQAKRERVAATRAKESEPNVLRWLDEALDSIDFRIEQELIHEEREF